MQQWTKERAWEWYDSRPHIFGCNFLPSTAVNSTDMWQAESFDAPTIERELQLACGLGYNSVRVFMPFIVWDADRGGMIERIESFLALAHRSGISMMPILFDDCAFAEREPYLGEQAFPVPGVHNSQWTPSPGFKAADDKAVWPRLEAYVKDIVSSFGSDPRVLIWDLYNEAGNSGRSEKCMPLLGASFRWAREADPNQPITAGSYNWEGKMDSVSATCEEESDVISFHSYQGIGATKELIDRLSRYERPMLCTEWLHRPMGSRFQTHLKLWKEHSVGIYNWGLAAGKTQTNLNWSTMAGTPNPEPKEWQHDVMMQDGTMYDPSEIAVIRESFGIDIEMTPIDMTPEVMQDLEDRELIIHLTPAKHELNAPEGETLGESIYESSDAFGPHKLIAVTVNREEFTGFATHPDNEEFFLIGSPHSKPLFLAVALCMRHEFEKKVKTGRLSASDLVLLRCMYNDPEMSFFVMKKDVPHGEAIVEAELPPATFYVTESRDLPLDLIEMRKYRLKTATT